MRLQSFYCLFYLFVKYRLPCIASSRCCATMDVLLAWMSTSGVSSLDLLRASWRRSLVRNLVHGDHADALPKSSANLDQMTPHSTGLVLSDYRRIGGISDMEVCSLVLPWTLMGGRSPACLIPRWSTIRVVTPFIDLCWGCITGHSWKPCPLWRQDLINISRCSSDSFCLSCCSCSSCSFCPSWGSCRSCSVTFVSRIIISYNCSTCWVVLP